MSVDLPAYLDRVRCDAPIERSLGFLRALHLAHARSIPFENVDVILGLPISLDPMALQAKLVRSRRGGYCFEQNTLLAEVLEATGFPVTRLAARVRAGRRSIGPRTHMLLAVGCDGRDWLCDVGFGGSGLVEPIPLDPGPPVEQFGWIYRVNAEGEERVLQSHEREGWVDRYAFTLEPQHPVDFEVANHYTSTHPRSPFTRTLTAQRPDPVDPHVRVVLRGRKLVEYRPDAEPQTWRVADDDLLDLLADRFGLVLPPDTSLPAHREEAGEPSSSTTHELQIPRPRCR